MAEHVLSRRSLREGISHKFGDSPHQPLRRQFIAVEARNSN